MKLLIVLMTDIPSNVIYDLVKYKLSNDVTWTIDSYTVTVGARKAYNDIFYAEEQHAML